MHTLPVNDLIEHVTDGGECPCGPTTYPVFGDWYRLVGTNVVHHSLDGRELNE